VTAFLQYVVTGISVGAGYALVGIGIGLVFRTTNALNFAQGIYVVLAGLTTSVLASHMPIAVAALIAIALGTLVGLVTGFISLGGRAETTPLLSLIITLGLALIGEAALLLKFGDGPHTYDAVAARAWDIRGVLVQPQYVLIVGVTFIVTGLLTLVLRRTIVGNALVACSDSRRAARLVGLDTRTLGATAFAIAGLTGAIVGVLITPILPLSYNDDINLAINGFAAAAFGGLVSMPLTLLGGLVLGIAEKLVVGYWNGQYELAVALVIMLVLIGLRSRNDAVA
jgi:branched-chain amino acid transport system permease protein